MLISARNLAVTAQRGPVFGPLAIDVANDHNAPMVVVSGAPGEGRTSVLLTLAGRMKPDRGTASARPSLSVLGAQGTRPLQRQSAIAGFIGIDDLEDSVSVGAALRERLAFVSPWYAWIGRQDDAAVADAFGFARGHIDVPTANTTIWDLSESQRFVLRIALALTSAPRVLVVDNLDRLSHPESIWRCLLSVAASGTLVVVGVSPETVLPPAVAVSPLIRLDQKQI